MGEYTYLLYIAIILFSTRLLGFVSKKMKMPQVVGALTAGIILGPSLLNLINLNGDSGILLNGLAEIGVIFLMFSAGLETDLKELRKNSLSAFVVAAIGVLVPIASGFLVYHYTMQTGGGDTHELMKAVFVGVVLSATSVSITVETLRELGKLTGKVGTTILGAAVIDDILGIIVLTLITSMEDSSVSLQTVLIKILLYFVFIGAIAFLAFRCRDLIESYSRRTFIPLAALVFCLGLSYISEAVFGIADITGAYFAGLILCSLSLQHKVSQKTEMVSALFFSPIFFASVGLKTSLGGMNSQLLVFSLALLAAGILSKILGCGLGAKLCGFSAKDALQIGTGMVSRGEVALIVAQKGFQYGLLDSSLFAPVVLVVIVTTLLTPVMLKVVMREEEAGQKHYVGSRRKSYA